MNKTFYKAPAHFSAFLTATFMMAIFLMTVFLIATHGIVDAQTLTPAQRAELQAELTQVEAEQKQAAADLSTAQAKSSSLSSDIAVLGAKIKAAQLKVKQENLLIQTLGDDIVQKQSHINDLEDHIAKGKASLEVILRKTNEIDAYSVPEVILSQNSISGFFNDIDTFQSIQNGLQSTFDQLQSDEASTTAEKNALTERQNAETDARHAIQVQQANIQTDQTQQKQLLAVSKGNEKSYSTLLVQKQARAAQIRAALFSLAGGSNPIPFGDALKYAQAASAKTGVDPAFLLAILTQESNLGKNVGSCYLVNSSTGAGINVKTSNTTAKVMSPTRDVPPFLSITQALGLDPYQTIVSCPQSIGWGGAMGPSQFIASTWALIQDRVAQLLGLSGTPNPWNPEHAVMAEALFMSDLGASSRSYSSELTAACKYFGGGTRCTSVTRPYGVNVMALADSIQQNQINVLAGL